MARIPRAAVLHRASMDDALNLPQELCERLDSVSNLPSPSRVAMAIMKLARDPDLNLSAVGRLINKDPALASKILRTANSALFAQRRRSDNLRKALIVLGLNATLTLALSFTLADKLRKQRVEGLSLPEFWRHCLLSATAARVTGEVLGCTETEDLFLAGLLQDLGILAVDKCMPGFYAGLSGFDHDACCEHERAEVSVDHAAFGAWLLQRWNMPERLVRAVATSHRRGCEHENAFDACVAVSGAIAAFCVQPDDDAPLSGLAGLFEATTGRPAQLLGEVLVRLREQIPDVESLYESSLIDTSRAESIVDQAREILMMRNLQALRSAERRTQQLEEQSRRDALTGAFNRAHMMKVLDQEFESSLENGWPLSVAFIDLDEFKQINDTHGHLAGDRVLSGVAAALVQGLRDSDIVTRYGGDEFVVIMPGTDNAMATAACRRITEYVAAVEHDLGNGVGLPITISMGVASLDRDCRFDTVEALLTAADAAVYAVKQNGRAGFRSFASLRESGEIPSAPTRDYREADLALTTD